MSTLFLLFGVGLAGALLFEYFQLPGGVMTGAMIAVALFNSLVDRPAAEAPQWLQFAIYTGVGVLIGNMYRPGMLRAVADTWPALALSTLLILAAGCLCAWIVARSGVLSADSAYLATSPGGFNAIIGLSLNMNAADAPIVMIYHLVRIYAIVLLAPYIARGLAWLLR